MLQKTRKYRCCFFKKHKNAAKYTGVGVKYLTGSNNNNNKNNKNNKEEEDQEQEEQEEDR